MPEHPAEFRARNSLDAARSVRTVHTVIYRLVLSTGLINSLT